MIKIKEFLLKSTFFIFILFPVWCFSQVTLTGKVKTPTEAVPFANVVLLDSNGKIVAGNVTAENGTFEINAAKGTYKLSVTCLHYKPYTAEIILTESIAYNDILLEKDNVELKEVVVSGKKSVITRKVDRLVFNVENNVATSGGDAVDALRVSPGIAINNEGISMIGKSSMRVMINGTMIQLAGEELVNFLLSIPADDIKEIEIITNPPAKYEADGNSGLINIIYKKGRKNAWSNRLASTYTQADLARFTFRNNFKYQKNKVDLIFSLDGSTGNTIIDRKGEIFYSTGPWITARKDKWNNENLSGKLMLDYNVSKNSKIGFQYLGSISNPNPFQTTKSTTTIYNNANTVDSLLVNFGKSYQKNNTHSLNTYYRVNLDTLGRNMSVDFDYFKYNLNHERNVNAESFMQDGSFLNALFSNSNMSNQNVDNYSIKADFEHPLKIFNLSYGAKASFTTSRYDTNNYNTITGTPVLDPTVSDDFKYKENNQSLYVNGSKKWNKKWNFQLGFRIENTQTKGISYSLNETNTKNYIKLFPTFYTNYEMNELNNFSFNYGRRIKRPLYYQLNPARNYISSIMYVEGNPELQPSFTDNFELSHTFSKKLITTLFLSIESNGFGEIADTDDQTNVQFFMFQNYYTDYNYGISEFYTYNKVKWWDSQNSISLSRNTSHFSIDNDIVAKPQNGFRFYASTNNTFTLNTARTLRGQINYWYSSPFKNNLFEYDKSHQLDMALKLDLFNKNLQTSLGVYDIFNTSPRKTTSYTNNIKQTQVIMPSNRYVRLSLVYIFGNNKINVKDRNVGNETEKQRAGN